MKTCIVSPIVDINTCFLSLAYEFIQAGLAWMGLRTTGACIGVKVHHGLILCRCPTGVFLPFYT